MKALMLATQTVRSPSAYRPMLSLRRVAAPQGLILRHASTAKPVKARVLPQPDAFRPPSHAARRTKPKAYPGPALSEQEQAAQKTRQYPHMMPPEGTFMHWFLTNRALHLWITLSVLVSLTFFTVLTNFLHKTPFRDQLPPNSLFFSHPLRALGRWWEVYQMHTDYLTAETMARREAKVEDVRKRSEYRKAHGIDEEKGLGGWTFRSESAAETTLAEAEEMHSPVAKEDGQGEREPVRPSVEKKGKWFGIW